MSTFGRHTRLVAALFAFAVAPVTSHRAEAEGTVDPAAIRQVILAQIAAFARDDGIAAFFHASPEIKRRFATAERFMRMVRRAYRPVYRPRSTAFRPPRRDGDAVWQPVEIVGPEGRPVLALYRMERQPDGTWRIGGCVLLPLAGEPA